MLVMVMMVSWERRGTKRGMCLGDVDDGDTVDTNESELEEKKK